MHKYRLIAKKGEGTFSEVLKAQSIKNGKYLAIKCMKNHFDSIEQVNNLREIQALRRLSPHPNIIKLYEVLYDQPTGRLALVFELMDKNIYEVIRGRRHYVSENRVKGYMYQLMKSMDHMHRNGIFHRDVKPENILIMENTGELKLADFGSCRGIYSKQPYTEYISTRWYRAPECLLTDGYYGYKMDMWGVGCVMFEVLALYPLFPGTDEVDQIKKIHKIMGTPPPAVLAKFKRYAHVDFNFPEQSGTGIKTMLTHVSRDAIDIIEKLLAYDPEDRMSARQALRHPWFHELRAAEKRHAAQAAATQRSSASASAGTSKSSSSGGGKSSSTSRTTVAAPSSKSKSKAPSLPSNTSGSGATGAVHKSGPAPGGTHQTKEDPVTNRMPPIKGGGGNSNVKNSTITLPVAKSHSNYGSSSNHQSNSNSNSNSNNNSTSKYHRTHRSTHATASSTVSHQMSAFNKAAKAQHGQVALDASLPPIGKSTKGGGSSGSSSSSKYSKTSALSSVYGSTARSKKSDYMGGKSSGSKVGGVRYGSGMYGGYGARTGGVNKFGNASTNRSMMGGGGSGGPPKVSGASSSAVVPPKYLSPYSQKFIQKQRGPR